MIETTPSQGVSNVATPEEGTRGPVELRYSVGDLCLFRLRFRACRERRRFDPASPAIAASFDTPEIPSDVAVFIRSGLVLEQRLPTLRATPQALCYVRNLTTNHYIDLSGTFEEYLKGFSSKSRSTLQRKVRKIAAVEGGMECKSYRTPDSMDEFHRLSRQVAVKTYQEKLFDGAMPASAEFLDRMRQLASKDCVRGFVLTIKGVPVSYLYLPAEDGTLTYGYLGYDPDYAALSPGTVLLYLALEQIFAERKFRYFNFTHGENQAKQLFGRSSFLQADLFFFRWSPRNVLAVCGHVAMDWSSSKTGAMLQAIGLKQLLRKFLRR